MYHWSNSLQSVEQESFVNSYCHLLPASLFNWSLSAARQGSARPCMWIDRDFVFSNWFLYDWQCLHSNQHDMFCHKNKFGHCFMWCTWRVRAVFISFHYHCVRLTLIQNGSENVLGCVRAPVHGREMEHNFHVSVTLSLFVWDFNPEIFLIMKTKDGRVWEWKIEGTNLAASSFRLVSPFPPSLFSYLPFPRRLSGMTWITMECSQWMRLSIQRILQPKLLRLAVWENLTVASSHVGYPFHKELFRTGFLKQKLRRQ